MQLSANQEMSEPLSVRFQKTLFNVKKLESLSIRRDSAEFQEELQNILKQLLLLQRSIDNLSIFSSNEEIDELGTKEIRYLETDYHIAHLLESSMKSREKDLRQSKNLYMRFLDRLQEYGLLTKRQSEILESDGIVPRGDPASRRDEKMSNFKAEQELEFKIEFLENPMTNLENMDDEVVRDVYISQLKLFALKSFKAIESLTLELDILSQKPKEPKIEEIDSRMKQLKSDFGFTDKLESTSSPLLSKEGKVMRPFNIVSSRDQLAKKVYGTGQVLPSMTVEEYLDEELKNGGLVKPAEAEKELDEDDLDQVDADIVEKRAWDEFKEANAKGSGNTINRG